MYTVYFKIKQGLDQIGHGSSIEDFKDAYLIKDYQGLSKNKK
jgi:hypothetical protein